jgi:tetratricopeptide (TPR) repeat protein
MTAASNKGMKQMKPSLLELRSLSPVFGRLGECPTDDTTDGMADAMADEADDGRVAYEGARAKLEGGDPEGAVVDLERAAEAYPHFKTLELLGEAWLSLGKPERAVVPLAAATTLNPQAKAPSLLAEALVAIGDEILAHRVALVALERDPRNKRAQSVKEATQVAYDNWNAM